MKKTIIPLILSFFLMAGTGSMFADNHKRDRGERQRHEQTERRHNSGKHDNRKDKHKKKDYKDKHNKWDHKDKHHNNKHSSKPRPGAMRPGGRPTPPPPPRPHYRPTPPPPPHHVAHRPLPPRLRDMVAYATRGGRLLDVWQVDPQTFIVKFRHGNRLYTQMLYPYSDRYGQRNSISVNWQPLSPWTLIPSINLNINL